MHITLQRRWYLFQVDIQSTCDVNLDYATIIFINVCVLRVVEIFSCKMVERGGNSSSVVAFVYTFAIYQYQVRQVRKT